MYPSAPLVLVALEVRHPPAGPLSHRDRSRLKSELGRWTPIRKDVRTFSFEMAPGSPMNLRTTEEEFPKFFDRGQTVGVSAQSEATIIELSSYLGWEDCLDLVRLVMESRNRVSAIDGVLRVGLRYINEIRLPAGSDWGAYLHAPVRPQGLEITDMMMRSWQGAAVYNHDVQQNQMLNLRYGILEETTIAPGHDLNFPDRGRGEFYLLDLDSYTTPKGTPEFKIDELMDTVDRLHHPLRTLFEQLITDKYRDEVLRK